jgi:hypothetical protein
MAVLTHVSWVIGWSCKVIWMSKTESFCVKFILSFLREGSIGLHHPLDGVTNPEYKLLHFIQLTKCFCKEKKALVLLTGIGAAI